MNCICFSLIGAATLSSFCLARREPRHVLHDRCIQCDWQSSENLTNEQYWYLESFYHELQINMLPYVNFLSIKNYLAFQNDLRHICPVL
jgi:hypothetical protein